MARACRCAVKPYSNQIQVLDSGKGILSDEYICVVFVSLPQLQAQ